jgi:hypothetical protein
VATRKQTTKKQTGRRAPVRKRVVVKKPRRSVPLRAKATVKREKATGRNVAKKATLRPSVTRATLLNLGMRHAVRAAGQARLGQCEEAHHNLVQGARVAGAADAMGVKNVDKLDKALRDASTRFDKACAFAVMVVD